jgi:hypothetical protein
MSSYKIDIYTFGQAYIAVLKRRFLFFFWFKVHSRLRHIPYSDVVISWKDYYKIPDTKIKFHL